MRRAATTFVVATITISAMAVTGVLAACSDETIVLASVVVEDDAGAGPSHTSVRCVTNDDCPDEYCELDYLTPFRSGHCARLPRYCEDEKIHPVCGISGITYFNDCYRKQAGESESIDGFCPREIALDCDDEDPCPIGATCELLGGGKIGATCGSKHGHCWGIIPCPPDSPKDPDRWDECSTEPGALRCADRCAAIQTGRPFTKAAFGCQKDAGP